MPRGAVLRNSLPVTCVVAFTGPHTKIALNQGKYKFKISEMSTNLNFVMFYNLVIMLSLDLLMS